jgi:cytochrome c-type biogenesis protein
MEDFLARLAETFQSSLGSPLPAMGIAFVAGILSSFTPCVYPIIPVFVSYIGSRSGGSRMNGFSLSVAYVIGLATVYALLGAVAGLTGGIFGQVQSSFWAQLLIANILLLFGLSMFDVFQIHIPSIGPRRQLTESRGLVGAFVFGAVSGLIASPCTAPVVGVMLTLIAERQNPAFGTWLMFIYACGLGLPLVVLGTFTGLLASLPRAGAWMNTVKKVFGIAFIILAQYYLIQAGRAW